MCLNTASLELFSNTLGAMSAFPDDHTVELAVIAAAAGFRSFMYFVAAFCFASTSLDVKTFPPNVDLNMIIVPKFACNLRLFSDF